MTKEYHFIQELREQPNSVRASLESAEPGLEKLAAQFAGKIDRLVLTGCGDPYMLAIAAAYAFEEWAGVLTETIEAAELSMFRNHALLNPRTLIALITSSGKTVKVIDSARIAHQQGAPVFALTNRVPSPITAETDQVVQTQAGWSDSFPTKQTTAGLALLNDLALHWAQHAGTLDAARQQALHRELHERIPAAMTETLQLESQIKDIANRFIDAPIYQYIGSGPNIATAMLGAAKIKETSQGRAESSNVEEFAHLHGLSMKEGDPIWIVTEPGPIDDRNRLIARWILTNGGFPLVVGPTSAQPAWQGLDVTYVGVPDHDPMFGPLISLLPLQMFAYYIAIGRSRNPDRPPDRGDMQYIQEIIYTSVLEGWKIVEVKPYDVVALGNLARELLAWVPRYPDSGDGILPSRTVWTGGGMAGNFVHALARLGGRAALTCAIGDDEFGDAGIKQLQDAGVDTRYILRRAGMRSPFTLLMVNPELRRAGLVLDTETHVTLRPDDVPDALLTAGRVFFTDLVPPQTAIAVAERSHWLGVPVAFDMQMTGHHANWDNHAQNIERLAAVADYFFADKENFLLWRGCDTLEAALSDALRANPRTCFAITRGLDGSVIATNSKRIAVPAFPVDAIDGVGAGDAYHAAFLYTYTALAWDLERAGIFASAVAALSCRAAGGRDGLPTFNETIAFLHERGMGAGFESAI